MIQMIAKKIKKKISNHNQINKIDRNLNQFYLFKICHQIWIVQYMIMIKLTEKSRN
jgi:hypothetical protein